MSSALLKEFIAGLLTILLPCILPLVPIVLGVSIADRNRLRPLVTIGGMVISFVGSTFLLQVVLSQFVTLADIIHIATYQILFLFGIGFLFHTQRTQVILAFFSGFFFWRYDISAVIVAGMAGACAMTIGSMVATRIQQLGTDIQTTARTRFGAQSLLTALIVGLTLGLVWVPCAGPLLSYALAQVRDEPNIRALLLLSAYGIGAGLPLLLIGYGGQAAIHSVRTLSKYSGLIKQTAGVLLILSAIGLSFDISTKLQLWFADHTSFGSVGTNIEESLFGQQSSTPTPVASAGTSDQTAVELNNYGPAPEFAGLGPWHNSQPLTLASLRGKVVLVDFWTYSCINCIRTLPYIEGYWEKYKDKPFVIIGVHTPEFTFEKDEKNVAGAIQEHGLKYPIAQDNDYDTWNAFQNKYWPAKYLIDAQGNIRYVHFGEGNYEQTDAAIAALLKEMGVTAQAGLPMSSASDDVTSGPVSPETYVGARMWSSFANATGGPSSDGVAYTVPSNIPLDHYALGGTWQLSDDTESQVLQSDTGTIAMHFQGGEINLVLGLADGAEPAQIKVSVDGEATKSLTIDSHDLYNLYKGKYGDHTITLRVQGKGVEAYAFTFGG